MMKSTAPRPLGAVPALVGSAAGRVWHLPPRRNKVAVERGLRIPMRDGTVLLADHYLPLDPGGGTDAGADTGPRPTVLMRCPYGRGLQFATLMGQPYAERGYHVLIQSVRGTFGSGGAFHPGVNEADDGQDTVAWLRTRDWFDGRLATVGASYLGYVQWALALDPPPELTAMIVHVGPHDLAGAGSGHGPFELYNLLMWSELMASQERYGSLRMMWRTAHAEKRLAADLERLPLRAGAATVAAGAPWYGEWFDHPDLADPFWDGYRAPEALDRVAVPVLLISGFHDFFLEQTLEQYRRLSARGAEVAMILGPWTHLSVDPHIALTEALAWLDAHAAGNGPARRDKPVRVWVGGAGEWRDLRQWPPAGVGARTWYLAPGGSLAEEPAGGEATGHGTGNAAEGGGAGNAAAATAFRYDPADPTPSVGGRLMAVSGGSADNTAVEARADVLTFTGPLLAEAVEVAGAPTVDLHVSTDNPYADVFVRLCDVDEHGRSFNLTDQILRLPVPVDSVDPVGTVRDADADADADVHAAPAVPDARSVRLVTLELPDIAHRFRPGHRIRLQISGGAYPRFARNMGTGEDPADGTAMAPVAYLVHHDAGYASCLTLPVLKPSNDDDA